MTEETLPIWIERFETDMGLTVSDSQEETEENLEMFGGDVVELQVTREQYEKIVLMLVKDEERLSGEVQRIMENPPHE